MRASSGALAVFTSGSTGAPKAALLPWGALLASAEGVVPHVGLREHNLVEAVAPARAQRAARVVLVDQRARLVQEREQTARNLVHIEWEAPRRAATKIRGAGRATPPAESRRPPAVGGHARPARDGCPRVGRGARVRRRGGALALARGAVPQEI